MPPRHLSTTSLYSDSSPSSSPSSTTSSNRSAGVLDVAAAVVVAKTEPSTCRLGFIGTGTIATAIVHGLATADTTRDGLRIQSIGVSQRTAAKSKALAEAFPELVTVHDNNQVLVDNADIIFCTVLPQQTKEVLKSLQLDAKRHVLVSLVSTSKLDELAADAGLPLNCVYKMICLPAVATHNGVCLLTPPSLSLAASDAGRVLTTLLESLGGVVEAKTEYEMSVVMVTTGLMGSFYGLLQNNRNWLMRHGIDEQRATFLVTRQYHSMMADAESRVTANDCCHNVYEDLIAEQTPGGLNQQALQNLQQLETFERYDQVQDAMLRRILGQSDGSLSKITNELEGQQ